MKKIVLSITISSLLIAACNFSAGTNKDLGTGLSYSYNGFSVKEVVLTGREITLTTNEIELGTPISIAMRGIENYELKDGKAFPGLMINVIDKNGNFLMGHEDLFADGTGFSPADAAFLRGSMTVREPMVAGETYHLKVRVWDKNKPENELTAEVDILVK